MKHILNEMSDEEKNSIRSQHTGSLQVQTERFKKLVENKLGDAKPLISEDFNNLPSDESLEEDMIDDEDDEDNFDDEDDNELETDDEDVLTVDYILDEVKNALNDLGEYKDSMEDAARELAKDILLNIKDDLAYLSENHEEALQDILDSDDSDDSDEDEDDMMDLGISESYLTEHWHDYDSEAILNPRSIKYSKNPNVDDFLESVFPGLDTETTKNAFRKLLHNEELFKEFASLMRIFGYDSYHNKEEIFDKVISWANERGNH